MKETLAVKRARNTEESFVVFIENLINDIYFTNDRIDRRYYLHTLLTQSTRSVLQLLHSWDNTQQKKDFIVSLKHTFYTTIKKKLESYSLIELTSDDQFLNLLSIYIIKENIGSDNHLKLIPQFTKDNDNIAMLYLNAMANNILSPKDYLAYFIKICYATEIFQNHNTLDKKDKNQVENFIESSLLNSKASSEEIAKKLLTKFDDISAGNVAKQNYKIFGSIFIKGTLLESLDDKDNVDLLVQTIQKPKTYNFISFFKLLSRIADISSTQNTFIEWSENANNIVKVPLYVLSKIWIRFAETLYVIEDRSENSNKNYAQIFSLYLAGFLNAAFVEIELYFGNKDVKLENISTSSKPYLTKFKNYKGHTDENGIKIYTLFDYLHDCPLLNFDNQYLTILEKISNETEKILDINNKKHDFKKVGSSLQKDLIKGIAGWETYALITISNKLRSMGYSNVPTALIRKLRVEMLS